MSTTDQQRNQHRTRAIIGITAGLAFAAIPAVGMYFDEARELGWLWILLLIGALPAIGWGSSHLALYRGYPSGVGCSLCIIGYIVSGFLGTTSRHPLALGVGVIFIGLLPTVVFLALPDKSGSSRRRRIRM